MEEQKQTNEEKQIESLEERLTNFILNSKKEISDLKKEIEEVNTVYKDFIQKPSPTVLSKAEKLADSYEKINEYNSDIKEIDSKVQKFQQFVYGKSDDDETGFKFKLNKLKKEHEELHDDWSDKYQALSTKIEDLLPGATSAGLAKSYYEQKKSYGTPNIVWSGIFILTMGIMVYYAIDTIQESKTFTDALMNILARAPFFIPTIWLALFASKRQSQNRRLEQEYAHKESLTKSYDGYKREIDELPESEEKNLIMEKLVAALVDAAAYNPSETLEKNSHNDSPPLLTSIFGKRNKTNE